MSYLGTFDGFTTSRLAIYAAQLGLNTTGNNVANINTTGYTRQVLDQVSLKTGGNDRYASQFDLHAGTGVLCTSISQIRDPYLDIRYRTEMSNVGAEDAKLSGLQDLAAILDEVGKGDNDGDGIINAQISDFLKMLEKLNTYSGQEEYDTLARASADALVTLFNSYSKKLDTLYNNTVKSFNQDVTKVNEILTNIRDLNSAIRKSDIHGDNALELRDERNLLIDELSKYMKIDVLYSEEDLGGGQTVEKLTIKLGNANPDNSVESDSATLVDGTYAVKLLMPDTIAEVNSQYDPNKPVQDEDNPDPVNELWAFKYLKDDGTGTNDEAEANQVANTNFDLTLSKLLDKYSRVWEETEKPTIKEMDPANPPADITPATTAEYRTVLTLNGTWAAGDKLTVGGQEITIGTDIPLADANDAQKLAAVIAGKLTNPDYTITAENGSLVFTANTAGAVSKMGSGPDAAPSRPKVSITRAPAPDGGTQSDATLKFETMNETVKGTDAKAKPLDPVDDNNGTRTEVTYTQKDGKWYEVTTVTHYSTKVPLDDNDLYGSLQSTREILTESGEFASAGTINGVDENAAIKRGIPYYQKSLDLLARKFAETFNEANKGCIYNENGNYVDQNDQEIELAGKPISRVDGLTQEQKDALIADGCVTESGEPDLERFLKAKDGKFIGGNLFSNRGDTDDAEGITAGNISVSQGWSTGATRIVTTFQELFNGEVDNSTQCDNVQHMITLLNTKLSYNPQDVDPNAKSDHLVDGTFHEMLNNMCSVLADDQRATNVKLNTYYSYAVELDTSRDNVAGVDLNDETMNLMQYQKALTAAFRLMTTLDEALDRLISNTGVVGR